MILNGLFESAVVYLPWNFVGSLSELLLPRLGFYNGVVDSGPAAEVPAAAAAAAAATTFDPAPEPYMIDALFEVITEVARAFNTDSREF